MSWIFAFLALLPGIGFVLDVPWLALAVFVSMVPIEYVVGRSQLSALKASTPIWFESLNMVWSAGVLRVSAMLILAQNAALLLWAMPQMQVAEMMLLAVSSGIVTGGLAVSLAHELGHRHTPFDRLLSLLLLTQYGFGQYRSAHNLGHHKDVGTPVDHASAPATHSVWRFAAAYPFRTWQRARVLERGRKMPWQTRTENLMIFSLLWAGFVLLWGGPVVLVASVLAALLAHFLTAAIDYIEHWGLRRRATENGYEKVGPQHIWGCNNRLDDALLLNLVRHPHHHLAPGLRAHQLQLVSESPQLPTGYLGMVFLAMAWPMYRRVMEPRLPTTEDGEAQVPDAAHGRPTP